MPDQFGGRYKRYKEDTTIFTTQVVQKESKSSPPNEMQMALTSHAGLWLGSTEKDGVEKDGENIP